MKAIFRKALLPLGLVAIPTDDNSKEALSRCLEEFLADIKLDVRNIRQLRLYWALMQLLADNIDYFHSDRYYASDLCKIAAHECESRLDPRTGEIHQVPRSIAVENMEQDRFDRLFNRLLYIITSEWLTGTSMDELRAEVFALCEPAERSSLGKRIK